MKKKNRILGKHNKNKAKKRVKYDTHRIERNRCKTTGGWAERLNLHPATIRGWLKTGELKAIDTQNPPLIHASDMRTCMMRKNEQRRVPVATGEIFCFTCKAGRYALKDSVHMEYNSQNRPVIRAICSTCGGKLFRITNKNNVQEKMEELKKSQHRLQGLSSDTNYTQASHYHEEDFVVQYNAVNERLKFKYFDYLKEARGLSDKSLKTISASILGYERLLNFPSFSEFDKEMAKKLKKKIKAEGFSVATAYGLLTHFKDFLSWLKEQTGFKAKLHYTDIKYLNVSRNEKNSLGYKRYVRFPSVSQIIDAVLHMPAETPKQKRDQAMIALIALTGIRDGMIPYLRVKHVNMQEKLVIIEPKEVPVKCGNYYLANFLVKDERLIAILQEYVMTLSNKYHFCDNDPLFPKLARYRKNDVFTTGDYSLEFLRDAQIIQRVYKKAFSYLPDSASYTPHAIRHSLIKLGKELSTNPQELKAWSQSIGHTSTRHMMETYGHIDPEAQIGIINNIRNRYSPPDQLVL